MIAAAPSVVEGQPSRSRRATSRGVGRQQRPRSRIAATRLPGLIARPCRECLSRHDIVGTETLQMLEHAQLVCGGGTVRSRADGPYRRQTVRDGPRRDVVTTRRRSISLPGTASLRRHRAAPAGKRPRRRTRRGDRLDLADRPGSGDVCDGIHPGVAAEVDARRSGLARSELDLSDAPPRPGARAAPRAPAPAPAPPSWRAPPPDNAGAGSIPPLQTASRDRPNLPCRAYAALISMILNFTFEPRGVTTSTVSPFLRPMIALPTGDSFESLLLGRVRLRRADDEVLDRLLRVHVAQAHDGADGHDARVDAPLVDDLGVREPLLELRDAVLEHHLLVLRVVVLRVLGDLAELASCCDALRDLAPPRRRAARRARSSAACSPRE